jgi:RNA polymerase sigma-70 factor (family 1)
MNSFTQVTDEKELLTRLNNNDPGAFTDIYNLYWKKLFFIAAQKLNDLSEAEEIVQDIFLDIWNRRTELAISGDLSSYLSVSVKYKVINILAKRNRQLRYHLHVASTQTESDLSTEHNIRIDELREQLSKETAKLPEKCRMVFQMSREEGYSQKQIAKRLSISEKTVESHLSKALRTLRTNLSHLLVMLFLIT